jgi:hypothetical protein
VITEPEENERDDRRRRRSRDREPRDAPFVRDPLPQFFERLHLVAAAVTV